MYHIMTNLEARFRNLDEAVDFIKHRKYFLPYIPRTTMDGEDKTTKRICVAPTLEDCVTALTIGAFKRCCDCNEDAKSYENEKEVYPVIVVKFADDAPYYKPTEKQVPDVERTDEHWLLKRTKPAEISLKWLDAYSVEYKWETKGDAVCTKLTFVDNIKGRDHPWLNGKGHPLECKDMGRESWPVKDVANAYLALRYPPDQLVYVVPTVPFDGYVMCYPIHGNKLGMPFREHPDHVFKFSGFYDVNGKPIFQKDRVEYNGHAVGIVEFYKGSWIVSVMSKLEKDAWFHDLDIQNENQLPQLRLTVEKNIDTTTI